MSVYSELDIAQKLNISKAFLSKFLEYTNLDIHSCNNSSEMLNTEGIAVLKGALHNFLDRATEEELLDCYGVKRLNINNRRYLGNKFSLSEFIRNVVKEHCNDVNTVADVFSGTGSVSNIFKDKTLIVNDLLYSNYLSNYAWFGPEEYSTKKIIERIAFYNSIDTNEDNYMRDNFADTFFSADDCSKIGWIREDIEKQYINHSLNFKEYAILITSLLYSIDKIANTVGHYDAYRKNSTLYKSLEMMAVLPDKNVAPKNTCYNIDANELVRNIKCDLLYLDPPYNSRQYCDAYHLLENVARWKKPVVTGVARKMNRKQLKSAYCVSNATKAFEDLIKNANARYILLSYNNMAVKGNDRSNAKISDEDILRILKEKGEVSIFEFDYKSFTTGKSDIKDNKERLFLCKVRAEVTKKENVASPLNYIGGKFKILDQIQALIPKSQCFLDLFAGGANVGINSDSPSIILNDSNRQLMGLIEYIKTMPTEQLLSKIDNIIELYDLSNTTLNGYSYYGVNSSIGLASYNKDRYLKLRADYNQSYSKGNTNFLLLYVLIVFSFNNQVRFNSRGEFNLPVGKRDFNIKMREKLRRFSEALKVKSVTLMSSDFRKIDLDQLPESTFIYCDPPYLITGATYNENNGWTENDERDLHEYLDLANIKGHLFALSNVLVSKGKTNYLLEQWIKERGYYCTYLKKSYSNSNYQRKNRESVSVEVLVTNYKV